MKFIQHVILISLLTTIHTSLVSQSYHYDSGWWFPNGKVYAVKPDQQRNVVYVGGSFDMVGPSRPYSHVINTSDGKGNFKSPVIKGIVNTSLPDGNGGWFVAGEFKKAGDLTRNNLCQLDSNGAVTAFGNGQTFTDGKINCMVLSGNTLFIAGKFSNCNGKKRENLAAIDIRNGNVLAWAPGANNEVLCLYINKSTLFAGGRFSVFGTKSRFRIAAVDTASNVATNWDPAANNDVFCLTGNDTMVIAGGAFTNIGGLPNSYLAEIDYKGNILASRNFQLNSSVTSVCFNKNNLVISGSFSSILGTLKSYAAQINISGHSLVNWDAGINGPAYSMTTMNGNVYLGGNFTQAGGTDRRRFAVIDLTSGSAGSILCHTGNTIHTVSISGNKCFFGGNFLSAGGVVRNNLAAISLTTKIPTSWNPSASDRVNSILVADNKVYVAGRFLKIGKISRNFIVAIRADSAVVLPWNPMINGSFINTMCLYGTKMYLGGSFWEAASIGVQNFAVIDTVHGYAFNGVPTFSGEVNTIAVKNKQLLIGGNFIYVNSISSGSLISFDTTNFKPVNTWNNFQDVKCVESNEKYLHIGGLYYSSQISFNSLDTNTNKTTLFGNAINGDVSGILAKEGYIIVGGGFTSAFDKKNKYLCAVDNYFAVATSWNPNPNKPVNAFETASNWLFIGGEFDSIDNRIQEGFSVFKDTCTSNIDSKKVTACDQYTLNNHTYTSSGTFYQNDFSGVCASKIKLDINIKHSSKTGASINAYGCKFTYFRGDRYDFSGTYRPRLVNSVGCDSFVTLYVVLSYKTPVSQITYSGNTLESVQKTGTYQWLYCDSNYLPVPGATKARYTVDTALHHVYALKYSEGYCSDTSKCIDLLTVGTHSMDHETFSIYPNPAASELMISIPEANKPSDIAIYNIRGQLVYSEKNIAGSSVQLDVKDLPAGMYFIQCRNENRNYSGKFLKE